MGTDKKSALIAQGAVEINGFRLAAEDGVFRGFGDAEFDDFLGLDLDGFAGLGVAADAGGAGFQDELADAGQGEGVLRMLVGEAGDEVEDFHGLFFGNLAFFRNDRGELGFGESFSHNIVFY